MSAAPNPIAASLPHESALLAGALTEMVGNTPLLRLDSLVRDLPRNISIWAKAEHLNPGGSVKDRPALRMIEQGIREGRFHKGKILLDSTSGNTGIAYATICSALGFRVKLCMSAGATRERQSILRAHGVDLVLTRAEESSDGAALRCKEIFEADPEAYFYPDQYNNPANWQAHYYTTGPEVLQQTAGEITHFVAGVGTSGTLMGVGRRLRQELPSARLLSVQPSSAMHGLEGLKHMETAIVPGIYDATLADGDLRVDTEDAWRMCKRIAREEGLLIGVSAGGNLVAARRLAETLATRRERACIVTVLCDGAAKYLSEPFWDDPDY